MDSKLPTRQLTQEDVFGDPDDDDEQATLATDVKDLTPDEEVHDTNNSPLDRDQDMPDAKMDADDFERLVGSPTEPIDPGILLANLADKKTSQNLQKTMEQTAGHFSDILRLSVRAVVEKTPITDQDTQGEFVTLLKRPITPTELVVKAQQDLTNVATAAGRVSPMTIYRKNSLVEHKHPLDHLSPPYIPPKPLSPGGSLGSSPFTTPQRSANSSPRQPPLLRPTISCGAACQQGYRRINAEGGKRPLHEHMEDIDWCERSLAHPLSGLPCWIHVLADGHGGVEAPRFFVARMKEELLKVVYGRAWQFDDADDRHEFSECIKQVFADLDKEYCEQKKEQYISWRRAGGVPGDKHTLVNGKPRPIDDGCTMVVNVVYGGDSRTVLARRPMAMPGGSISGIELGSAKSSPSARLSTSVGAQQQVQMRGWGVHFASVDHAPSHPDKALFIHQNGGLFINDNGTRRHVKIDEKRKKPYPDLVGARILRPPDETIKEIGVSHLRTLNLASTMGDLLYKIAPAILSSVPDISFVRLTPMYEYVVVIATDGVWDHLKVNQGPDFQARHVIAWLAGELDNRMEKRRHRRMISQGSDSILSPSYAQRPLKEIMDVEEQLEDVSPPGNKDDESTDEELDPETRQSITSYSFGPLGKMLIKIARKMTDREGSELYFPGYARVDDCTVSVALLRPTS